MGYIPEIWAFDYFLGFLYLIIIYFIAFLYRSSKLEKDSDYKYYLIALNVKMGGGLGFLLLTVYYWGGGDTYTYYHAANGYTTFMLNEPVDALKLLFVSGDEINWMKYEFANSHNRLLSGTASFTMVKITAMLNLLGFKSYVTTTVLFSFLSFLGVWNMYFIFCKTYPQLKKQLLFAIFFIPSVVLWGSGILKDTITIGAVGSLVYAYVNIVQLNRKKLLSLILIVISTSLLLFLKPYILYVLYPALFLWLQSDFGKIIKNDLFRRLLTPVVAITIALSSYFLVDKLSMNADKYKMDKLETTLKGFQSWHTTVAETKDQSGYTLGDMDFSTVGLIKKFPQAINVTFFRPYLWEIRNSATLLGAFEGLILMLFSLFRNYMITVEC